MVRTLLMPPLNASAGSWSWSWDRGSTLVAAENPRGARSSRSSYSSYSSSSRPRYTLVFFMNEGDIPSPVLGQRSACSAARAGPDGPVAPFFGPDAPAQPDLGLHERLAVRLDLTLRRREGAPRKGPGRCG